MKSRPRAVTADLFAAASAPAAADPAPLQTLVVPPPAAVAPATSRAPVRTKHLWYAAVFPQLDQESAASNAEGRAAVLRRLSLHAQQFTSLVSIEMPNSLLLEIGGSIKLFGSLEALHADIDAEWSRLKHDTSSATAPSALAALWFARAGKRVLIEDPGSLASKLADLPLACTSWDLERLQTLHAMGVTRVGELLRLPRAGLARRFGPAAVLDLDLALARQAAPRRAFVPRERFRERCDFETEVETVAYLEKTLEPLVERCARFLRERQAGVQALELRLEHRTHPLTRVHLGLASTTSEQRRFQDVLAQQLSRLELAAPIRRMTLLSGPLQPLPAGSLDAFAHLGGAGGRDTAPQLVERLRARLGEQAVYGICPVPEHRPEAAWRRVHELSWCASPRGRDASSRVRGGSPTIDQDLARPVWLLDEPTKLRDSDVRRWRQGEMIFEEGPERIESGWWDGRDVARDYYIARRSGGARLWIFQERQSKCWYLHGVFA
ncbi:MAG TPA: DNA polymerase Y family protein [Steroidobacteraceae bacterium]|nr:DNA polymerase Y family protein [Steroidobacteraceae bacterium]